MNRILQLERVLLRVETWCLVALVGLMLALAGYNVAYRNLLVPLQRHWATSGPAAASPEAPARNVVSPAPRQATPPDEGAEGFGGGLAEEAGADEGGAEGFGGGLAEEAGADEGGAEGFGGGLAEEAQPALSPNAVESGPSVSQPAPAVGGLPREGSWRARAIAAIDAVKIEWIDVLLRQLVIIVSFLGAMLATHRRKHINVDALSRLLSWPVRRVVALVVDLVSVGVCTVLAVAGRDLVSIGRDFPKDLFPWADEWQFQLMFPVGFGLLALHFVVRALEDIAAMVGSRSVQMSAGSDGEAKAP